jgi:5-methylcytosine-specific restriction endonuclease McrA
VRKKICSCGKIIPDNASCLCKRAKKRDYMREYQRNDKDNPLKTTKWKHFRNNILRRDKYLCQRCLFKYGIVNSKDLQAHHIKSRKNYPELVFDVKNVICLCRTCNLQLGTKDALDFEVRR